MVTILMMSAKKPTLSLLKIKPFWNKGYDLITYASDVTNKFLLRDSIYIVNVLMWPKSGNSSMSMREVIIISILYGFDQKNHFFERWSCFKFNNLGLEPGIALQFYTSVATRLKLKIRKFWGLTAMFVEVTGKNW